MNDKCKSGRELRHTFHGLLFLLGDTFRVIDLEDKVDTFASESSLKKTFGKEKWEWVCSELLMNGFHESGRYRIEAWENMPHKGTAQPQYE